MKGELRRLDKIFIQSDNKLDALIDKTDLNNIKFDDFILNKFIIIFENSFEASVEFECGSLIGKCMVDRLDDPETPKAKTRHAFRWNLKDYEYRESQMLKNACKCFRYNRQRYCEKGIADDMQIEAELRCILFVCQYIMTAKRERIARPKLPRTEQRSKDVETKSKKYPDRKYFLLDEIIEYVNENGEKAEPNKTVRTMECDCWSVRGHYRHYKSGKTVFIKSYLKGKKRETVKPKPKEYYV